METTRPARPRRPWPVLLAALGVLGCGGFSGGGPPGLAPPEPPDFSRPDRQASLTGAVRVSASLVRDPEDPTRREGDWLEGLEVQLKSSRHRRVVPVDREGRFEAETLPPGTYQVEVQRDGEPVAGFELALEAREDGEVRLELMGRDLADLDGDGSRQDLAVALEVLRGPGGARRVRTVLPDGSVRTRLANGGIEYLLPGGVVRREQPGAGAIFRRDHDLDGVPDAEDRDLRRREAPEAPDDDELLLGTAFPPLIKRAWVTGPLDEVPPGDLALFRAELGEEFGGAPVEVRAFLHPAEGEVLRFELRDDGGSEDLAPSWPGHQPSGDERRGDGVFSHLVPIDRTTRALIYHRQVVVEAVDAEGRRSNRFTFFLEGAPAEPVPRSVASALPEVSWDRLREVRFLGRSGRSGPQVSARFEAAPGLDRLVGTLVGPGGFRRVFSPGARMDGGWVPWTTEPAAAVASGTYYMIVGVPGEELFFAGQHVDPEGLPPVRTGG